MNDKIVSMFIESEIFEDAAGNLGQAAGILRGDDKRAEAKAKSKEEIKVLADKTTGPHVDKSPQEGGQHADLPYLAKWLKDGSKVDDIAIIYSEFMDTPELRKKLMVKKFKTLEQFIGKVHEVKSKLIQPDQPKEDKPDSGSSESKVDRSLDHAKRYEDENITVYLGTDEETTRQLSCKNKYGLCIGATGGGNYFAHYRFKNKQSTYFVYFKNEEAQGSAPVDFIIIDIDSDGDYEWNKIIPNSDIDISEAELISKVPVVKPPFSKDVFKYIPPTPEEENDYNLVRYVSDIMTFYQNKEEYRTPVQYIEYMISYAKMGKGIDHTQWEKLKTILNPDKYKIILKSFIETSGKTLPDDMIEKLSPQMKQRYWDESRSIEYVRAYSYGEAPDEAKKSFMEFLKTYPDKAISYVQTHGFSDLTPEVKQVVLHKMKETPYEAFRYTIRYGLLESLPEVQQLALQSMKDNHSYAFQYVSTHGFSENPELQFINKIALHHMKQETYDNFQYILKHGLLESPPEVQQIALQAMKIKPQQAFSYVEKYGLLESPSEVQQLALQYMKQKPEEAFKHVIDHSFSESPEAIQQIALEFLKDTDFNVTYNVEKYVNKYGLLNSPPVIQHRAFNHSFDYVKKYDLSDSPLGVQQAAVAYMAENSFAALEYAHEHGFSELPPEVIQSAVEYMKESPHEAFKNIKEHGLSKSPPEVQQIALEYMKSDGRYWYAYVLHNSFSDTPTEEQQIVLEYMKKDTHKAFDYVNKHTFSKSPEVIQKLAMEFLNSHIYYAPSYVQEHTFSKSPEVIQKLALQDMKDRNDSAWKYVYKHGLPESPLEVQQLAFQAMEKNQYHISGYAAQHDLSELPPELQKQAIDMIRWNKNQSWEYVYKHGLSNSPSEFHKPALERLESWIYSKDAYKYVEKHGFSDVTPEVRENAINYAKQNEITDFFVKHNLTESTSQKILRLFLESKGKDMPEGVTQEMVDFFEKRTNEHIARNKKFVDIACEKFPEHAKKMSYEVDHHDDSKWEEPEYTPYLHITWMYKMKDEGKEYTPPDDIDIQEATFHHIKHNHHHPEMYDDKVKKNSINPHDRDKPAEPVDGSKMPDHAIICMVCDWCSMSDEKGGTPKKWADDNVNVRWMFEDKQKDLIYDAIEKIWGDKDEQD